MTSVLGGVALDDDEVVGQPRLLGDQGQDRLGRHVDEAATGGGELAQPALRHVHGADADGKAGAVVDEHRAVAVFDHPAGRLDLDAAQAVVLGLGQVLLAVQDLQEPQTKDQHAEQHDDKAADDRHAHRYRRRAQRHAAADHSPRRSGVVAPQPSLPHVAASPPLGTNLRRTCDAV